MEKTTEQKPATNGEHIELDGTQNFVVIKDVRISSKEVFEYLSRFETAERREDELKRVIEVGVAVLQKVELVSDTDYFDRRVEGLNSRFQQKIDELQTSVLQVVEKNFDPAEAKSYTRQLNEFFLQQRRELQTAVQDAAQKIQEQKEGLEALIGESFDAESKESHLGKLIERINAFETDIQNRFDPNIKSSITAKLGDQLASFISDSGTLGKILDERFSVTNPASPLMKFKEEIRKDINDLRVEIASQRSAVEAKEQAVQNSPAKGYVFEDAVFDALQTIAKPFGDIATDVSKMVGDAKRKAGDFTYDVTSLNKRIVVEARNKALTSIPNAIKDLEDGMQNRAAEFGIYVVESEDQLQKQVGTWNEYPDNKIITHAGLLEVAIKYARGKLATEQPDTKVINANAIRQNLTKISDALKKLTSIKTQVTTIRGSSEKIEQLASDVQSEIKSYVAIIDEELSKGANE